VKSEVFVVGKDVDITAAASVGPQPSSTDAQRRVWHEMQCSAHFMEVDGG